MTSSKNEAPSSPRLDKTRIAIALTSGFDFFRANSANTEVGISFTFPQFNNVSRLSQDFAPRVNMGPYSSGFRRKKVSPSSGADLFIRIIFQGRNIDSNGGIFGRRHRIHCSQCHRPWLTENHKLQGLDTFGGANASKPINEGELAILRTLSLK